MSRSTVLKEFFGIWDTTRGWSEAPVTWPTSVMKKDYRSHKEKKAVMPSIRHKRAISHGAILFWGNCVGVLDEFMPNKKSTSVEMAEHVPIKAKDPFFGNEKIDPMVDIEAVR